VSQRPSLSTLSPQQHAALFDAAKQRALRLRQEAINTFATRLGQLACRLVGALTHRAVLASRPCEARFTGAR
jgi:L-lactate utilization protein LutC